MSSMEIQILMVRGEVDEGQGYCVGLTRPKMRAGGEVLEVQGNVIVISQVQTWCWAFRMKTNNSNKKAGTNTFRD